MQRHRKSRKDIPPTERPEQVRAGQEGKLFECACQQFSGKCEMSMEKRIPCVKGQSNKFEVEPRNVFNSAFMGLSGR